jgi:adenylosuccinate lyase
VVTQATDTCLPHHKRVYDAICNVAPRQRTLIVYGSVAIVRALSTTLGPEHFQILKAFICVVPPEA